MATNKTKKNTDKKSNNSSTTKKESSNEKNTNANVPDKYDDFALSGEFDYEAISDETGNFTKEHKKDVTRKVIDINDIFNGAPDFDQVKNINEKSYYNKNQSNNDNDISIRESTIEEGKGYEIIDIPRWGYKDFINERIDWLKGTKSLLGEPAWFYFKIFFKFDTKQGLLGGVFDPYTNNSDKNKNSAKLGVNTTNTAIKYLQRISRPIDGESNRYNNKKDLNYALVRLKYLYQFIRTLAYISCDAPWFFSSVHDVNNAMAIDFNDLTKEKSITIDCLEDAIDMRLLTMMDLYRQACFDDVLQKEIIPENLRKFDMDIVVFQTPIRYLHTSAIDLRSRKTSYKSLDGSDSGLRMSFKLFSFKNCEFDLASLSSMLPSTFTNDKPFTSKPTIKINYDRVYQHTSNEFIGSIFGSGGTTDYMINDFEYSTTEKYIDETTKEIREELVKIGRKEQSVSGETGRRKSQLKYLHEHPTYYNPNSNVYKALVDASETKISSAMRMIDSSAAFGNLYGTGKSLGDTIASDVKGVLKTAGNAYKNMGKSFVNRWKF